MASTASTTGAKISMFGAKSGFVIPKNKLSGSLIPIFQRGNKTLGGADSDKGLSSKLGKRKSNWGPDWTQDSTVKKCRLLAYQKRLDQITQQLESGTLEVETTRESDVASENNSDIAEHLEYEKREAIGAIMELNPRYKAPPDYKPLLKEARLPIDVKEHSDFSFLSLILSSQGDIQKQLEKETGAKVQIFGTKAGGEKVELSPSDENEIQTSWQDLYFQISSDTYEKVDAAIAVIELLISSVSGNAGSGAGSSSSRPEDIPTVLGSSNVTATDTSSEQRTDNSVQPPHEQFQQHGSSFSLASGQAPFHAPLNITASSLGTSIQDQELPTNSMSMNPFIAQQPLPTTYNTSVPPGSQVPRPPDSFSFTHSNIPRMGAVQGSLAQLSSSAAPPYSGGQIQPIGPRSSLRPSTLFTFQPVPSSAFRSMSLPDIVSNNMVQSVQPLPPKFGLHPVAHQPGTDVIPPLPSSINPKHTTEYASGSSFRPMPVSGHITGRPAGLVPTYSPINTAPRPYLGDFGFSPQIPPRTNSQSAHLSHLAFQAPSVTPASQHFEQSFLRSQHFGRQMDQPLSHPSALIHGNMRGSNLQNFGPPLPQMIPRNLPGTQFPQHSAHFLPRPAFHHEVLIPRGQPQIHHRFNAGKHQVYDPFSPSDA